VTRVTRYLTGQWTLNGSRRDPGTFKYKIRPDAFGPKISRRQALMALGQVVYALRTPDGLIKVGCTTDLDTRLRWFRCHVAEPELLCFLAGGFDLEASLHDRFAASRAHGREWYHPTPEVMEWVNATRDSLGLPTLTEEN
jgi:hypothetical protein